MKTGTIQLIGALSLALIFFMGQADVAAQEVSGVVTDQENQESLPGVNIVVKGTTQGTTTDIDGKYSLAVESLNDTLVFSYVGYQREVVPINGRENIDIALQPMAYQGDEMVVVGYGEQEARNVTGAVSTISSDDIEEVPTLTTSESLVGSMEGVTFRNTDARPGTGTDVQIRNMGNPLFVIDGVPSNEEDFNQLGQGDIDNISVLKGASAAVYGMRASNGVVLVTTKSGDYGQDTEVSVSGYMGWQRFTRFPEPANAYQFKRAEAYALQNTGQQPQITPEELQNWKEGGEGYRSYDYFDIVMDEYVPQSQIKASVSGGSEDISYYFAATHADQNALIEDYKYKRTNLQANIEAEITDNFTMGTNVSGRLQHRHNVGVPGLDDYFNPLLSVFTMWPTESPYANNNKNYVHQTHNVNVNPATYDEDITGYTNDDWNNASGKLFANYEFDFGLKLKAVGQYTHNTQHFDGFEYTYNAYRYDEANDEYYTQPSWGNNNPWREKRYRLTQDIFTQFQANYATDIGKHHVDAMAAYEYQKMDQEYKVVHTVPSNNYIPIMEFQNQDLLIHDIYKKAHAGYVGRVQYNYDEKYILEVLGRYDGSYLFPPDERWGLFPAISVGWRVSDEEFFQEIVGNEVISNFKIRASYGVTGSETWGNNNSLTNPYGDYIVAPFSYMSGYTWGAGSSIFNGNGVTGLEPRGLPVRNLSWIENVNKNLGVNLGFFDNQLRASFDIFERRREGLPASRYDVRLPNLVGFTLPPENLNQDAVRGFEGNISYNGEITDELGFTVGGNFTLARTRILDNYKPRFGNSWDKYRTATEDRWANVTWGYQVEGRFQSMEEIENYDVNVDGQGNRTLLPGDFKYKDVNGDGVINGMDERPIGYAEAWDAPNPYMTFGLNGSFTYKGARLGYTFTGGTMQAFMRDFETRYPFQNNGNSPAYMFTDRWHRESPFDPNSEWISGDYPATRRTQYGHSNYRTNTYWLTNVSYIRLRNLTLSYNLPEKWLAVFGLNQVQVYAKGKNLFSIDNLSDYQLDPEMDERNALAYPPQKMYTFGFNIKI